MQDDEDSEEGSCLYPKKELPARTRLGQNGLLQGQTGMFSSSPHQFDSKSNPFRNLPINQKSQTRPALQNKPKKQKNREAKNKSLETSEEDDRIELSYKAKSQFQKPLAVTHTAKVAGKPIDQLTEEQLLLIKQMVDERIDGLVPSKKQRRNIEPNLHPSITEEDAPAIDDDFYDDKFLNLVYEMESQNEDSHNFFC